nr:MAG TPA: hypothetical protein [Caudoviricetes sp.]
MLPEVCGKVHFDGHQKSRYKTLKIISEKVLTTKYI